MSCHRKPRTTQERRANQEKQWRRHKRSTKRLVDAWDDIIVYDQRSWKKHRKKQYRDFKTRRHINKAKMKNVKKNKDVV